MDAFCCGGLITLTMSVEAYQRHVTLRGGTSRPDDLGSRWSEPLPLEVGCGWWFPQVIAAEQVHIPEDGGDTKEEHREEFRGRPVSSLAERGWQPRAPA